MDQLLLSGCASVQLRAVSVRELVVESSIGLTVRDTDKQTSVERERVVYSQLEQQLGVGYRQQELRHGCSNDDRWS